MSKYGICLQCNIGYDPVWFIEKETKIDPWTHALIKTGRARRAVSHLECPCYGRKECVDDSFDGQWMDEKVFDEEV